MIITINGIKHKLGFHHGEAEHRGVITRSTSCFISPLNDGEVGMLGTAYSFTHPKDNFNKAVGRRVALERLIVGCNRDVRRQIWSQYWKRVKR